MENILSKNNDGSIDIIDRYGFTEYTVGKYETGIIAKLANQLYEYENFFLFCENVGFEESYVTYVQYKDLLQRYRVNLVETEHIIEAQRVIKDEKEIKYIEKACNITDKCFEYLQSFIKIGMTEKEIAFEIERFYKTNGEINGTK